MLDVRVNLSPAAVQVAPNICVEHDDEFSGHLRRSTLERREKIGELFVGELDTALRIGAWLSQL